jgi:hypothetical protein
MVEYYQSIGKDPYNVIPLTFLVQSTSDNNFQEFEMQFIRQ